MSFVSIEFAILFAVVITLLFVVRNAFVRKLILGLASAFFYAWWDWRFLALLATITVLDFYVSRFLVVTQCPRTRKRLLWLSIVVNLGFLGVFKYCNFFLSSLAGLFGPLGWRPGALEVILPIGISFYTFETLSYVVDVYRGVARPARSLLDYSIFISFFPRLVAGPIMRARDFLPQLERGVQINVANLVEGIQLFVRGLLKKVVLADNLAVMVDQVYATPTVLSSSTVWLAVGAYAIQVYCDFSGYTDMARGTAKAFGFDLPVNFDLPYTAQSITEFWRRWHISLSSWLRDYLYVPLGGDRRGGVRTALNLMITMLLGGLWHGASWNFVLWGGLHGVYLVVERFVLGRKRLEERAWTSLGTWLRAASVFALVAVTLVPFRSPDTATTLVVLGKLSLIGVREGVDWYYGWAMVGVPGIVLGGFVARRFRWEWPVLSIHESYMPAVVLLGILLGFFFAPLRSSPFIYFRF